MSSDNVLADHFVSAFLNHTLRRNYLVSDVMLEKHVVRFEFVRSYGGDVHSLFFIAVFPFSVIIKKILDTVTSY